MMKKVIEIVPEAGIHWVGDGLPVRQSIGTSKLGKFLNPFILLDYAAPYKFGPFPRPRGVGMHPHRGFETVTIAFQGEITHTDSTGKSDTIYPGDVQWMTAGSGIEHSEMHSKKFTQEGGVLEMLQLWVNLPAKHKMARPKYQAITSKKIPGAPLPNGVVRVIAGNYEGVQGPARTFFPIQLWDLSLKEGTFEFKVENGWNCALLVRSGSVKVQDKQAATCELVVLSREGESVTLSTKTGVEVFIMSAEPITEPMVAEGPMVMNTTQQTRQAFYDYMKGKFKGK